MPTQAYISSNPIPNSNPNPNCHCPFSFSWCVMISSFFYDLRLFILLLIIFPCSLIACVFTFDLFIWIELNWIDQLLLVAACLELFVVAEDSGQNGFSFSLPGMLYYSVFLLGDCNLRSIIFVIAFLFHVLWLKCWSLWNVCWSSLFDGIVPSKRFFLFGLFELGV